MSTAAPFDWRTATPAEVDEQYSPSRFARRPLEQYLDEYRTTSAVVEAESLRVASQPLLVYIHGGYWQRLSAADSLFNAADAVREGVSLHAVEYTLAPAATIDRIVGECIADVVSIIERLRPVRVVLAGCSAGAHLAAMCSREPRVGSRVDGAALLSGIYDLRPLVVTPTNDPLFLDAESAAALSPQLLPPPALRAALCAVGEHESGEFIRQNREFAEHLRSGGTDVSCETVSGRDHFDLPYDLLKRGTTVGDWVLSVLRP